MLHCLNEVLHLFSSNEENATLFNLSATLFHCNMTDNSTMFHCEQYVALSEKCHLLYSSHHIKVPQHTKTRIQKRHSLEKPKPNKPVKA